MYQGDIMNNFRSIKPWCRWNGQTTWKTHVRKLIQREIDNMNHCIYYRIVVKALPTKKTPGPGGFTCKLNQTFWGKIIPILYRLFQKTGEKKAF